MFILVSWHTLWIGYGASTFIFPSRRRGTLFLLRAQMNTFSSTIHQKYLNLCLTLCYFAKVIPELKKNKNKEFSCVMMFIIRPNSTLKFQFIFGFWAIFSVLNFENFWFYICVVVVRLLVLRHKWLQITTYLMLMNEKLESKDHQIYSKTLKKICKKSQSHKKTIFWSTFSIYMVQTFLKILWWQLLVPHSECFLISSATLSCKTWNVSTFSIVYYNTNTFFLRCFWLKHWSVQFINQGFKCFWA